MSNLFYAVVKGEFGRDPLNAQEIALALTEAAGRMKRAGHTITETAIVYGDEQGVDLTKGEKADASVPE